MAASDVISGNGTQSNGGAMKNQEIDAVRNLLFGQQSEQINRRMEFLENKLRELQDENTQLRRLLEIELTAREQADASLNTQVQANTQSIEQNHATGEKLSRQLSDEVKTRKAAVKEITDYLSSNRDQQEKMLDIIRGALAGYSQYGSKE